MDPLKKKRRTPFSCTVCRRKKIKCDRTKPTCQRCQMSNSKCIYTAPPLFSNITEKNMVKDSFNNSFIVSLSDTTGKNVGNLNINKCRLTPKFLPKDNNTVLNLADDNIKNIKKIEDLQKQIDQLKNSFNKEIECISLVLDYDDTYMSSFRSKENARFASSGSFAVTSIWRRDPLMQNLSETFYCLKRK